MLDYLNEQDGPEQHNEKSSPAPSKDTAQKPEKPQQDDFVPVQTSSKSTRKTTILLAVLFVIGLIGLFFMIKKGAPRLASAQAADPEQKQVEMLVAKLGGVRSEVSSKMDIIVKKFYEFANVRQVAIDQLVKNPFRLSKRRSTTIDEAGKVLAATHKPTDFQLFSIMRTDADPNKWCCMVNDKLLYCGQAIADFTVTQIGANFVVLQSGENKITLKLADD